MCLTSTTPFSRIHFLILPMRENCTIISVEIISVDAFSHEIILWPIVPYRKAHLDARENQDSLGLNLRAGIFRLEGHGS